MNSALHLLKSIKSSEINFALRLHRPEALSGAAKSISPYAYANQKVGRNNVRVASVQTKLMRNTFRVTRFTDKRPNQGTPGEPWLPAPPDSRAGKLA